MFELLQELGKGGFATTYRARVLDPDLREEFGTDIVALKIPLNKQKERVLRRELEMNAGIHLRLRGLASTHIVRYLGFVSFHDQITMVMEYVEQGSLRGLLGPANQGKPLPLDRAVQIATGVLDGLSIIHHEGILHRDIKPENILMLGEVPKIADLGISRLLEEDELAMSFVGTPAYIAPEILTSHGATFSADLWSTSVMLYEMLTGRWPFGASRIPLARMVQSICHDEPEPPSRFAPSIPPALDAVLIRGLRKAPEERYLSAAEMREALETWSRPPASPVRRASPVQAAGTVAINTPPAAPALASTIPVADAPAISEARAQLREHAIAAPLPTPTAGDASRRGPWLRVAAVAAAIALVVIIGVAMYLRRDSGGRDGGGGDGGPTPIEAAAQKTTGAPASGTSTPAATAQAATEKPKPSGGSGRVSSGTGNGGTGNGGTSSGAGQTQSTKGAGAGAGPGTGPGIGTGIGTGAAGKKVTAVSMLDSTLSNGGTDKGNDKGEKKGNEKEKPGRSPEQACDGGDMRGCFELGEMYFAGRGVTQDPRRAADLYDRACQQQIPAACYKLAILYRDDRGVSANQVKSAELFQNACDHGVSDACVDIGLFYATGRGVTKDEPKGVQLFQKACDGGSGGGCSRFGSALADGRGIAKDDVRATSFFQRACDLGYLPGCDGLGLRYERGLGVKEDPKQAVALYERSCSGGGERGGCNDLGRAYQVGFGGLSIDLSRAADLYKRACDAANLMACVNLGALYVSAESFRADLPRALPLFLRACDGNTPRGCFMAGRAYGLAQGVAKDDERAKEFYKRGCDGNFAPACAAMGKSANLPAEATAWLSSADYHTIWDKQRGNGFYPGHVEGRLNNGREEFRATAWEPVTATCQTRSHHSLTEDNYRRASTDYAAQGFGLKSVSQFVGLGGGVKYQAVWTKGCEP